MTLRVYAVPLVAAIISSTSLSAHATKATLAECGFHGTHYQTPHHCGMQGTMKSSGPKLGIMASEISQGDLDTSAIEYGVKVAKVIPGSVAEVSGLKSGDVITEIDRRPVYSGQRLLHLIGSAKGESTIKLIRDGELHQIQVDLSTQQRASHAGKAMLGVRIQNMTQDLKQAFGSDDNWGVLVSQVITGSAAGKAGVKAGDVITEVADNSVKAVRDVHAALRDYKPGEKLNLLVIRDRLEQSVEIVLDAAPVAKSNRYEMPHYSGYHGHHGMDPKRDCKRQPQLKSS